MRVYRLQLQFYTNVQSMCACSMRNSASGTTLHGAHSDNSESHSTISLIVSIVVTIDGLGVIYILCDIQALAVNTIYFTWRLKKEGQRNQPLGWNVCTGDYELYLAETETNKKLLLLQHILLVLAGALLGILGPMEGYDSGPLCITWYHILLFFRPLSVRFPWNHPRVFFKWRNQARSMGTFRTKSSNWIHNGNKMTLDTNKT